MQITFFSQFGWKIGYKIENWIEGFGPPDPKSIGILIILGISWGLNVEIIAWIGGELRHGQAQNMVYFDFISSYIWPWRSINPQNSEYLNQSVLPFWSQFGNSGLNGWRVIVRTHGQTQATTMPEGQTGLVWKTKQSQVCRHVSLSNPLIRRYIFLGHIFYISVLKRKCFLGNMETPPFIYLVDKTTVHICYSSFQNTFAHYREACIVYHIIKPG